MRSVSRGHHPNCSSDGSVVGVAVMTLAGAGVVLSMWADRFRRWLDEGPPGAPLREEDDGAVLALDGARLHLDREAAAQARPLARSLPTGGSVEGALRGPVAVHLNLSQRCPVRCSACYTGASPEGEDSALDGVLEELAGMGVFELAFGGGEALLREDTLALAAEARALGMVPNLTTSGFGVGPGCEVFGQVNVSLDGLGEVGRAVRGWEGEERGLRAIRRLRALGVRVGVNTVLSRPLLETPGALDALGDAIVAAGAQEWQWLRLKPVGRGAEAYDPPDLDGMWPRLLRQEARTGLVLRIDCSLVPFLVHHRPEPAALEALAVRGCPGGASLLARDGQGRWAPCSFFAGEEGELAPLWRDSKTLRAWRGRAADPPEPCADCPYAASCRGGCRAVALALTGDALAPDPECPRVRAWRAA